MFFFGGAIFTRWNLTGDICHIPTIIFVYREHILDSFVVYMGFKRVKMIQLTVKVAYSEYITFWAKQLNFSGSPSIRTSKSSSHILSYKMGRNIKFVLPGTLVAFCSP